jgi:hypothetical protein
MTILWRRWRVTFIYGFLTFDRYNWKKFVIIIVESEACMLRLLTNKQLRKSD